MRFNHQESPPCVPFAPTANPAIRSACFSSSLLPLPPRRRARSSALSRDIDRGSEARPFGFKETLIEIGLTVAGIAGLIALLQLCLGLAGIG